MLSSKLKPTSKGYKIIGTNITIRKRPGIKNWEISIYYRDRQKSKVLSSGTDDLDAALVFAFQKEAEFNLMNKTGVEIFPSNFEKVALQWVDYIKDRCDHGHVSVHMLKVQESVVRVHLIPFFKENAISAIHKVSLQNYVDYMVANKLTARTTFGMHDIALTRILKFAKERGLYHHHEIPRIEIPKYEVKERKCRGVFNEREISAILNSFDAYIEKMTDDVRTYNARTLKALILFMNATGCRTNDIKILRWGDFRYGFDNADMKAEKITIQPTPADVPISILKALKEGLWKDTYLEACLKGKPLKGKPAERWVPCGRSYLETHLEWKKHAAHKKPTDLVFSGENGKFNQNYTNWFKDYLRYLRIPDVANGADRTPYSIRHTFITRKLIEGANVFDLAIQCGNSVKEIQKTYCHLLPEDLFIKIFKIPPPKVDKA